jgi:hypothetical protein
MKILRLLVPLITSCLIKVQAQPDMNYYFPSDMKFNPAIPTPKEILGFEVGEKHVSHDQLVKYMYLLSESSNRIQVERYGWTYEHRPLLLLTFSSPENLSDIEKIRLDHLKVSDPNQAGDLPLDSMPAVIWLGYSVHGNEPSGLNASLLVAYYLAAAESETLDSLLDNMIILLDPSINPDGYSRFEQWVNQYKSETKISDPNNLEHNEAWPRGRTNHYWFDLNRDWLPLQHMESQARIKQFYKWMPNILTDHHEMGSNSTFFFQPGIPSRINPNTPVENNQLTVKIASYHARALDEIGSLYYSKETFDDFYYGKGSSYPDVNGCVGILFEQASSRGLTRQTDNGVLEFPFTIRNQLTVSLSTLQAGYELRSELLNYQADFYRHALEMAEKNNNKAYLFDGGNDKTKIYQFLKILEQHQIEIHGLAQQVTAEGHNYAPGTSYIIPMKQKQYRLIKAIFEKSTSFTDSLFYDVSAWTFPLAFDLDYTVLDDRSFNTGLLGSKIEKVLPAQGVVRDKSNYAYLMKWDDYHAPKALYQMFRNNLKVKVTMKSFINREGTFFEPGTLLIPVKNQISSEDKIFEILKGISSKCHIDFYPVTSGLNLDGIDLGSPSIRTLDKPKIMMLVGDGVSSYEAGEVWHLLDYRMGIPVSMVNINRFNYINIHSYSTLILVNGNYNGITEDAKQKLTAWLKNGGQIIAIKGGARWLADQKLANIKFRNIEADTLTQKSYGDLSRHVGAQAIGGSIFETTLDVSHPLCFGYPDNELSVFKNNRLFFEKSKNPYNNPVMYTADPLLSGYISEENYNLVKNTSGVIVSSIGRGKTICFSDNPNFRAFWFGTNRLFFNAIFLGNIISVASAR